MCTKFNQMQKKQKCKNGSETQNCACTTVNTLKHKAVLTREKEVFYFLFSLFRARCCSDICFEGGGVGAGQVVGGEMLGEERPRVGCL